ncbi:PRC and DUF2382 domain-containing protein [Brevibacterium daeguense]|uniref:PRC and DUF2382 domain-containing protein n=1 Tax=Brevibacterium daeguense TaxID=909936 RepID=A0ABP8EG46_9MICO|nr:PRC and DUF2382 domain-containing protein [Brevibacterium daeguense]
MTKNIDFDALENANVYDSEDKKIGSIGQVYLDDQTQDPKFVTVNTGLFGTKETFVPFDAANQSADGLRVPFTKDFVKDAPNIDVDGHLTPDEERRLFEYYGLDYHAPAAGQGTAGHGTAGHGTAGVRLDEERTDHVDEFGIAKGAAEGRTGHTGTAGTAGAGTGTAADDEMVAREERLKVGTEQHEAGRARLRKRVRTEHQNVEVPVQREELVVEREKLDPNDPAARNAGRIDPTGDVEETVTLREERPVVDKETVATEKVDVGKRTVQDTETVSGDVRKEEIDIEADTKGPDARR